KPSSLIQSVDQAGESTNSTSTFFPISEKAFFKSSEITSIAGQPEYVGVNFIFTIPFSSIASRITPSAKTESTVISGSETDDNVSINELSIFKYSIFNYIFYC